jgi:riboflavin kinase/FMN adenylyltransferase
MIHRYVWQPEIFAFPGVKESVAPPRHPRSVALGIFDGIHLGHRAVISRATGVAQDTGVACGDESPRPAADRRGPEEKSALLTSAVFTFLQPPWAMNKEDAWELLTPNQKLKALESLGVEELIQADFDRLRDMSPEAFVEQVLHKALDARRVCCGFNYRFGKDGEGDAAALARLCGQYGIEVITVPAVEVDGRPVSASRIRRLIEEGEVQQAARLLGRPFTLDFTVVGGQKLGRLLGTPTINQPLPEHFVRPRFGVYASSVEVEGRVTHGVTNVGIRPTVGADGPLAETWIADFQGDLYGKSVPVSLVKFLRPEQKFTSVEELQKQILRDEQAARRAVLGDRDAGIQAVLFDFDDTLQNRPAAFLQFCSYFLEKYFPRLTREEKEQRAQEMLTRNNNGYVNYIDYFSRLIEDWGWDDAPEVGDIYREFQFRFPEYSTLFPETKPVLEALRLRGFKLGIITNGPSIQQNRKLDVAGLRPLVDQCIVSGDERVHKPDPEIFRRAAARLGVACESCVYVGDHPVNDVQGAQGAGMRPIYINVFGRDACPRGVTEIRSLKELLDIL